MSVPLPPYIFAPFDFFYYMRRAVWKPALPYVELLICLATAATIVTFALSYVVSCRLASPTGAAASGLPQRPRVSCIMSCTMISFFARVDDEKIELLLLTRPGVCFDMGGMAWKDAATFIPVGRKRTAKSTAPASPAPTYQVRKVLHDELTIIRAARGSSTLVPVDQKCGHGWAADLVFLGVFLAAAFFGRCTKHRARLT